MMENFTNKQAFLATLGLVWVSEKKEDKLLSLVNISELITNANKNSNKKSETVNIIRELFLLCRSQ